LLCLNKIKLNVNKSPGPDNLHPRILYEIRHEICYPLTEIFETSWKMSNIPLDWHRANIVAVYKKGHKMEMNNYRPISLTSVVCKLMESTV